VHYIERNLKLALLGVLRPGKEILEYNPYLNKQEAVTVKKTGNYIASLFS
jgi:hypothetical protein